MTTLNVKAPKWLRKEHIEAVVLLGSAYAQYTNIKERYDTWQKQRGFTVTLLSTDPSYHTVVEAILRLLPHVDQKYVSLVSRRQDDGDLKVFEAWSAVRVQKINIDGHEIEVGLEQPQDKPGGNNGSSEDVASLFAAMKPDTLRFWSKTHEGKVAVVNFMNRVVEEEHDKVPKIYVAARWGDWRDQSEVPHRTLETVVLKKGIVDDIKSDLESFLTQEMAYSRMGLPWHRGYLLHGCPGSGKTSLVRALASECNLDLYALSLTSVRDDTTLMNLFASVEPRSALLIEDIDTATMARDRDADKEGVSTSGLLNALDGVSTPHGLILFMTSNRKNKLDPALLRPGRCDRSFKISWMDDEQLARMVKTFVGETPELPPVPKNLAPASVIEVYKENLDSPENFVPALIKMLEEIQ